MSLLLSNALFNISVLLLLYLVGHTILISLNARKTSEPAHYFFSLLIGLLVAITFWALVKTHFRSLYIAAIPIMAWAIWVRAKHIRKPAPAELVSGIPRFLLWITIITLLVEFTFVYKYFGLINTELHIPDVHPDYNFYANVARHINDTGYENYLFNTDIKTIRLYHYTEIWLTSLLNNLLPGPYLMTLLFQAFPILFVIVWVGFSAIAETVVHGKPRAFYMLIPVLTLFVAPLAILVSPFSSVLKDTVYNLTYPQYYKLSVIYMFFIAVFLERKRISNMLFFLTLVTVFYATTLPAIAVLLSLSAVFHYLKYRQLDQAYKGLLAVTVLSYAILFAILTVYGYPDVRPDDRSLYELYVGNPVNYLITIINIYGSTLLKILITCSPYILLYLFLHKQFNREYKFLFAVMLVLQFIGLTVWSVFNFMLDSVQFWNNIYCTAINIMLFMIILVSLASKQRWLVFPAIFLVLANFYFHHSFSPHYHTATAGETAVIRKVQAMDSVKAAYIRHPSEFTTDFLHNTNFAIPVHYLSFFTDYAPVNINKLEIPPELYWHNTLYLNTPFARFIAGRREDEESLQQEYMVKNRINLLVISEKAETPGFIQPVTDTVIYDPYNRFRYVFLKLQPPPHPG